MMRNLKVRGKMLLGFALVSSMAIIVGLIGAFGLTSNNTQYSGMMAHSITGFSSLGDIRELFQLQRLMLRTIMINIDDPKLLQANITTLGEYEAKMAEAMEGYESTISDPELDKEYYAAKDAYLGGFATIKRNYTQAAQRGEEQEAAAILAAGLQTADTVAECLQGAAESIVVQVGAYSADLTQSAARMTVIQLAITALAAVLSILLGLYISSLIATPIKAMGGFFARCGSKGELELSESDQQHISAFMENRDEIGECIVSAVKMVARLNVVNENLTKVANGDLTIDMEVLSENDGTGLALNKMTSSLNDVFSEMRSASGQVSSGSAQIALGSQELATGSSQQAASIEEFSASLAELQEKTRINAENSKMAAKVNEGMGSMIEESVSSMKQMLDAMNEIDESSKTITRVIKVIDDIAFQTNILALNAAVEAARAGVHGKGFAVVADEVRNLASKSAGAAKETATLIEGSSEKVREGNEIVDKTNASLKSVAESSKEAIRLISMVSDASGEQSRAITEIKTSMELISNIVQENSASSEESAAAAEQMSAQANGLDKIVARFKLRSPSK